MARVKYNKREVDLFKPYCVDDPFGDIWKWLREHLANCPPHLWAAIMSEYVAITNEAFFDEKKDAKKSNSAAIAGNIYIRNVERDTFNMDAETTERLEVILEVGPQRKCSTCKHWINKDYAGHCLKKNSNDVRGICKEWSSRV